MMNKTDKKSLIQASRDAWCIRTWRSQLVMQWITVTLMTMLIFAVITLTRTTTGSASNYEETYYESDVERVRVSPRFRLRIAPPAQTRQSDLFISVKTTGQFHSKRLPVILETWYQLAKAETWFFTDQQDEELDKKLDGHLIVTNCPASHSRQALCCKMAAEFDAFLQSDKRWFCHFDDDNYVNVPALVTKLRSFDHRQDWYLGKPSISEPLEILDRDDNNMQGKLKFWFATGGAGFCLSRTLAQKMAPVAGHGQFEAVGDKIRLPDDVTMGYISEHVLGTPLNVIPEFHSHLEPQRFIGEAQDSLDDQISFSYSKYGDEMNVVQVDGFDTDSDPTRFKSLHCRLFPNFSWCPKTNNV